METTEIGNEQKIEKSKEVKCWLSETINWDRMIKEKYRKSKLTSGIKTLKWCKDILWAKIKCRSIWHNIQQMDGFQKHHVKWKMPDMEEYFPIRPCM